MQQRTMQTVEQASAKAPSYLCQHFSHCSANASEASGFGWCSFQPVDVGLLVELPTLQVGGFGLCDGQHLIHFDLLVQTL